MRSQSLKKITKSNCYNKLIFRILTNLLQQTVQSRYFLPSLDFVAISRDNGGTML